MFLLLLKRYAAQVVQRCWEDWAWDGSSYEAVSERWGVRCARTVQRWIGVLIRRRAWLLREIRRLWLLEEPPQSSSGDPRLVLLAAIRHALSQAHIAIDDGCRTPYFLVQNILHDLALR